MKSRLLSVTAVAMLSSFTVSQAGATMCQPYTMQHEKQIHFSATN